MNELKTLSNEQLLLSTDEAVDFEKAAITNTTRHFQEIFERRAYLPAYATMFEFLTKKYGYCSGSAQLRIGTIRLIREVPLAQAKIESGELSMTAAANIQTFLNSEKSANKPYSINAKIELVEACLGKSTREVQKEFVRRNPEIEKRETVRYTSEERVRIDISISDEALKSLNELRDLLSHVDPNMSLGTLVERLAKDGLERYCPRQKAERAKRKADRSNQKSQRTKQQVEQASLNVELVSDETSRPNRIAQPGNRNTERTGKLLHAHEVKRTRYVSPQERQRVEYDGNGCTFVDPKSGMRCCSKKFLQLDHIVPFAEGGSNSAENLRWMCGIHNRWLYSQQAQTQARTFHA